MVLDRGRVADTTLPPSLPVRVTLSRPAPHDHEHGIIRVCGSFKAPGEAFFAIRTEPRIAPTPYASLRETY